MMKQEFEKLAGYEVSFEDFNKVIEPMYMATDLSKEDFVKVIDRKRFEIKKEKTSEQKDLENQINNEIKEIKKAIEFIKLEIRTRENCLAVETDELWIKTWKNDIKRYKEEMKLLKNRIATLKWVLA